MLAGIEKYARAMATSAIAEMIGNIGPADDGGLCGRRAVRGPSALWPEEGCDGSASATRASATTRHIAFATRFADMSQHGGAVDVRLALRGVHAVGTSPNRGRPRFHTGFTGQAFQSPNAFRTVQTCNKRAEPLELIVALERQATGGSGTLGISRRRDRRYQEPLRYLYFSQCDSKDLERRIWQPPTTDPIHRSTVVPPTEYPSSLSLEMPKYHLSDPV